VLCEIGIEALFLASDVAFVAGSAFYRTSGELRMRRNRSYLQGGPEVRAVPFYFGMW
jgi:hypothetical protein